MNNTINVSIMGSPKNLFEGANENHCYAPEHTKVNSKQMRIVASRKLQDKPRKCKIICHNIAFLPPLVTMDTCTLLNERNIILMFIQREISPSGFSKLFITLHSE